MELQAIAQLPANAGLQGKSAASPFAAGASSY
jgi:hypothetical protein